jgi:hypothetical protein
MASLSFYVSWETEVQAGKRGGHCETQKSNIKCDFNAAGAKASAHNSVPQNRKKVTAGRFSFDRFSDPACKSPQLSLVCFHFVVFRICPAPETGHNPKPPLVSAS